MSLLELGPHTDGVFLSGQAQVQSALKSIAMPAPPPTPQKGKSDLSYLVPKACAQCSICFTCVLQAALTGSLIRIC